MITAGNSTGPPLTVAISSSAISKQFYRQISTKHGNVITDYGAIWLTSGNEHRRLPGARLPADMSVRVPGPMDSQPKHHWLRPPIFRGRARPRWRGDKRPPQIRIPKRLPKRRFLEVSQRIAEESDRLMKKDEGEEYFPPPWGYPQSY